MNDNIGKRSSSLDIAFVKFSKDNPPKGKLIQEDVHNGPCHGWLSSRLMLSDATRFPTSWCSWIDINEHFCCHWLRQSQQATWGAASYGVFGQKKGNVFVKSGLPHWLRAFLLITMLSRNSSMWNSWNEVRTLCVAQSIAASINRDTWRCCDCHVHLSTN